ncbi:MAG TPA: EF-P beta-lysylation protein EpmB [Pirellulales bacterium]|nr:EF-P beta-lysylation protein EpmB [Pirellulales bacterium]
MSTDFMSTESTRPQSARPQSSHPQPAGLAVAPLYPSWQQAMKDAIRDPVELCHLVGLPAWYEEAAQLAARGFPVFAPRSWVARMRFGNPRDPLLRQVLPLEEELSWPAQFETDPVGDRLAKRSPGLLHKYNGRVLLVTTGACAVHCRYCFRRHFPYGETPRGIEAWQPALTQIAADPSVTEVILSGGDPLTLVDEQLALLAGQLADIGHLRRLRVHTRLPIMIPDRVTDQLIDWLCGTRLAPVLVIHANHAAELDDSVEAAIGRLADAGVMLLNQSVLLAGVNDSVNALEELSERLLELRVMPYYLHQLDRVAGAAHFEVPESTGRALVEQLRARLPGYAVPRYVREEAGALYKIPLA